MDAARARAIHYGLATLLVLAVALSVALAGTGGEVPDRPPEIEGLSPADGSQVPRQQPIVVDLVAGFEAELFIRDRSSGAWVPVPATEVTFEPATGILRWLPPPGTGTAGQLDLRVEFRSVTGPLRLGAYEWSIRTY